MKLEWDGGKLTKKLALFLCWKLWEWLAETGEDKKESWPEWAWNEGHVERMDSYCPCCEYTRANCKKCPLFYLWPHEGEDPCLDDETPFGDWLDATTLRARKKYASIIAEAARKEYEAKP